MWACRPVLTPAWAIVIFVVLALVFIPLGAASLAATQAVVEVSQRYDDRLPGADNGEREALLQSQGGEGSVLNVQMTAPDKMEAPIFIYYEVDGMMQNHRR